MLPHDDKCSFTINKCCITIKHAPALLAEGCQVTASGSWQGTSTALSLRKVEYKINAVQLKTGPQHRLLLAEAALPIKRLATAWLPLPTLATISNQAVAAPPYL